MREQCSSKPVGIRRHYRRCALATPHIAVAFLLVALYLIFGPTNSDVNLVLAMPRVHVVFNEPAAVPAAPAPGGNATDDDEDRGLPPPRQLTDPPYSLGRAILDYDARRSTWLAAHSRCPDPDGDHLLLRAFKNKADYYRVHGLDMFYDAAFLDAEMSGFSEKLPRSCGGRGAPPGASVAPFVGCKPCRRYADSYPADQCRRGMERAFTLDLAECELQSAGLHPALFVLTSLRYLDLSFNESELPVVGFERLTELTYLNLVNL